MPLSVRLDPAAENAVKRLARERKQTRSAIVREAIAAFEREQDAVARRAPTPWDALAHLIGTADSGGARLSQDTGAKFSALLREKARARRSR